MPRFTNCWSTWFYKNDEQCIHVDIPIPKSIYHVSIHLQLQTISNNHFCHHIITILCCVLQSSLLPLRMRDPGQKPPQMVTIGSALNVL